MLRVTARPKMHTEHVEIEPKWNVKRYSPACSSEPPRVEIEPKWNVKWHLKRP